jgi:hypothetical protein
MNVWVKKKCRVNLAFLARLTGVLIARGFIPGVGYALNLQFLPDNGSSGSQRF